MDKEKISNFVPYSSFLKKEDFRRDRPFIRWYKSDLEEIIFKTLNSTPQDLEVATLAFYELKIRKKHLKANKIIKENNNRIIDWLPKARELIKQIPKCSSGNSNLYVILRGGYTKSNNYYGVYVGASRNEPEIRFNQHKSDIKISARGLPINGIQLLRSLYWKWEGISSNPKILLHGESALHLSLKKIIKKVSGNVEVSIENWDKKYLALKKYLDTFNEKPL